MVMQSTALPPPKQTLVSLPYFHLLPRDTPSPPAPSFGKLGHFKTCVADAQASFFLMAVEHLCSNVAAPLLPSSAVTAQLPLCSHSQPGIWDIVSTPNIADPRRPLQCAVCQMQTPAPGEVGSC